MNDTYTPNADEYEAIKRIANSSNDGLVFQSGVEYYRWGIRRRHDAVKKGQDLKLIAHR
jgi:hypothetical protein